MKYKQWLTYYKKSLSDSLQSDLDIEKHQYFEIANFKIANNRISDIEEVEKLIDYQEKKVNKEKGITDKDSEDWISLHKVQVVISPFKIKPTTEHLVYLKDKKPKFPFWFSAKLDRTGKLHIPEEIFPIFQRKFLEPIADEKTEFIFGSVDNIDKVTPLGKEEYKTYFEYIGYLEDVFKKAIHQEMESYSKRGYETIYNAIVLLPNKQVHAAIGIIKLYEKILHKRNVPELLKAFITVQNGIPKNPIEVSDFIQSNPLHVGQMGFDFPISISQRKSLYTFLQAKEKVFAVNGPPGTGKTTLLQSIVANKMVESAIVGNDAPIILACSANNQAVTNIIDSFSRSNTKSGKLQGRWLPRINGYATYLPNSKKTEADLKGINYRNLDGMGLFKKIEHYGFLRKAKVFYTEKCAAYFGGPILNINDATVRLQKEIVQIQSILKDASLKWEDYLNAEKLFSTEYLDANSTAEPYYENNILNDVYLKAEMEKIEDAEGNIIRYFDHEPFLRRLGCSLRIRPSLKNRAVEIRRILRNVLIDTSSGFAFTRNHILEIIDVKIVAAKTIIQKIAKWKNWKTQNSINGNPPKTKEEYWEFERLKIKNQSEPNCFYDELDVSLRHKAFQLALHYWEGRYLEKLEEDLPDGNFDGKGLAATKNRWRRHAMLTPCFVSTFFMAPKFFTSMKFLKMVDDKNKIFDFPPLYDFLDLLIVDEAGQVPPEIGIATFALAKQAVIVGDVKQIEPVWKVTNKIDIGNLRDCGLIRDYDDLIYEKEFDPKGFLCSTGSIMKMAQNACNFKERKSTEKGVLLLEHRRCYDEIIAYCNALAYDRQLIPLKGKAGDKVLFPPMYCIHVEGNSTAYGTSRRNQNEVKAITNWLVKNRTLIEEKYGKLENAVGIITPFVGQKKSLRYHLGKAGFKVDLFKLGTVHALQGAERPIILFSMVYGKGDSSTMFFDRGNKPNMLNVAVSRAKDNFIVFANTEILDRNARLPSGILSNHLTYEA